MGETAPLLGVMAGIAGVACMVPYIRDTLRRATRPHPGTWLIWGALAVVVCASQYGDGASWSLLLVGSQVLTNAVVVALAIRRGVGGLGAVDAALIAVAGAGVAGWAVAGEPVVATVCVIGADLIAVGMMVPKTWREPGSETLSTYAIAALGGALAALSVGALAPALVLYPAYYCAVNAGLALLIWRRRAAVSRGRPSSAQPAWA